MRSKLTSIVALATVLAPSPGNAMGFGEIILHSRVGEPLMAEVPILSTAEEQPSIACFSLTPIRDSELPVITAAKTRLIQRGKNHVLQIYGSRAISEPIFAISVQASCGHSVVRDYVLMPEAPVALAETSLSPRAVTMTTGNRANSTNWHAQGGETLEHIADAQVPANSAERQRLISALKRATPDISPGTQLTEGTVVRIPTGKPERAERKEKISRRANLDAASDDLPPKPAPAPRKPSSSPPLPTKGIDQLVLGAAPEEVKPAEKGKSPLQSLAETEQKILRLEATLQLLTQEVEKMDQALDLATKAIEAQNKLHVAQTPPPSPAPVTVTSTAHAPANTSTTTNWLGLLLSAAAGATISVGFAQHLSRRRGRSLGKNEATQAFSEHPAATATTSPQALSTMEIVNKASLPGTRTLGLPPPPPLFEDSPGSSHENVEAKIDDEDSVLALAEIMLSFGRVHGATETLAEHIDEHMPKNIQPWSMLLDLYRRGGMREEFTELAERMRTRFNASIPDWNDSHILVSGLMSLEDYPHVIQKTGTRWGTQACLDYLFSLVHDTRAGQRNGFPLEVVEEIALLMRVLEDAYELKRPS